MLSIFGDTFRQILNHPPYLLAFLLCTLLPFLVLVDYWTDGVPGKKTMSADNKYSSDKISDVLPPQEAWAAALRLFVEDADGQKHRLDELIGQGRVLVVFIRHFFCGVSPRYFHQRQSGNELSGNCEIVSMFHKMSSALHVNGHGRGLAQVPEQCCSAWQFA